jgi:hypothetical protein
MLLAYVGVEKTEAEAIRLLNAQEYGTPSFAIQRLSSLGLNVRYQEWSIAELMSALVNSQPLVIFVRTGFLDYWQIDVAHALIIVGVDEGKQFWVHDPARPSGPQMVSWDGLLAAWAEFGYRGATVTRRT